MLAELERRVASGNSKDHGCECHYYPLSDNVGVKVYRRYGPAEDYRAAQDEGHGRGLAPKVGSKVFEIADHYAFLTQAATIRRYHTIPDGAMDELSDRYQEAYGYAPGDMHAANIGFIDDDDDSPVIIDWGRHLRAYEDDSVDEREQCEACDEQRNSDSLHWNTQQCRNLCNTCQGEAIERQQEEQEEKYEKEIQQFIRRLMWRGIVTFGDELAKYYWNVQKWDMEDVETILKGLGYEEDVIGLRSDYDL